MSAVFWCTPLNLPLPFLSLSASSHTLIPSLTLNSLITHTHTAPSGRPFTSPLALRPHIHTPLCHTHAHSSSHLLIWTQCWVEMSTCTVNRRKSLRVMNVNAKSGSFSCTSFCWKPLFFILTASVGSHSYFNLVLYVEVPSSCCLLILTSLWLVFM